MRRALWVAVALGACGPSSEGNVERDSGVINTDGGGTQAGAVQCQTHMRTVVHSNGTKTESRTYFALIDVGPLDEFRVESCGYKATYVPPQPGQASCPATDVCSDSGPALPDPDAVCTWTRGIGSFIGGKLYLTCGSGGFEYAANGSLTSSFEARYATIRVHR